MADRNYGQVKIEGPRPVRNAKGAQTITPTFHDNGVIDSGTPRSHNLRTGGGKTKGGK